MPVLNKKTTGNSIILGLYLSIPMLSKVITSIVSFSNNVVILSLLLLLCNAWFNAGFHFSRKYLGFQFAALFIFAGFAAMPLINGSKYVFQYLEAYILNSVLAVYFCSFERDDKITLKTILAVYACYILMMLVKTIPEAQRTVYVKNAMEISYSSLVGYAAALFCLTFIKKKLPILAILAMLAVNTYYLLFLSDCRGAVLALAVLFALLILYYLKSRKNYWLIVFVVLALAAILLLFSGQILEYLIENFQQMRWLKRFEVVSYDITSGRGRLFELAGEMIKENWLLGAGIGAFEVPANGQYTHNLYLQLWVEFGCLFGTLFALVFTVLFLRAVFQKEKDLFLFFLLPQILPRLLISSVHWNNMYIWVFLFVYLVNRKSLKAKRE